MKKILSFFVVLLCATSVFADGINRGQAQQIASDFFASRGATIAESNVKGVKKAAQADETFSPYYIFNAENNKGFVIVSGNDLTAEILGYSDSGNIDEDNLPECVKSWFDYYADEIKWVEEHAEEIAAINSAKEQQVNTLSSRTYHAIAPLLTSLWNQRDPYNMYCPIYYESDGTSATSVTGCIATAMAQVMYFYKYPNEIKADIPGYSKTFSTTSGTKTVTLNDIPAGAKIDWDNIYDSYDGTESDEAKIAVAALNRYCGQSVKMNYGSSSGANYTEEAFEDYFDYDDDCFIATGTDYDLQTWFDMIYDEIETGHPVPFSGFTGIPTTSGHAFVLDGFDGEDLFHVNWGWGGNYNGYFRLTVLKDSDNDGNYGASADGYSRTQKAVIGLHANDGEISPSELQLTISSIKLSGTTVTASFKNTSSYTASYECAILTKDSFGNITAIGDAAVYEDWGSNTSKSLSFDLVHAFTEPGQYRLTPGSRALGSEQWYAYYDLSGDCIMATVDDDLNVTLESYSAVTDISVTNWDYTGDLAANSQQSIIVTLTNNGDEYCHLVYLYASQTSTRGSYTSYTICRVKAGETGNVEMFFTPGATGTWNLWLTDGNSSHVLGETTVDITSTAHGASLTAGTITVSNNGYGNFLQGTIEVTNNSTESFTGPVKVRLCHCNDGTTSSGTYVDNHSVDITDLAYNETILIPFKFTDLIVGDNYYVSTEYVNQSGNLTNGSIHWGTYYTIRKGVLRWTNEGAVSGNSTGSRLTLSSTDAAVLFYQTAPGTVVASGNPNTIYAYTEGLNLSSGIEDCNIVEDNVAEEVKLSTDYAYFNPVHFTANSASLTHEFSTTFEKAYDGVNGWEAITLPFKPDGVRVDGEEVNWKHGTDDGVFYLREFSYEEGDGTVMFTDVEDISSMRRDTPYVIAAARETAGKTIEFYGTDVEFIPTEDEKSVVSTSEFHFYGTTIDVSKANVYVLNSAGTAYEYTSETVAIAPFTNYFTTTLPEDARPDEIIISYDIPNGIQNVNSVEYGSTDDAYYDLQGRKINTPTKGVYIHKGKKFVK